MQCQMPGCNNDAETGGMLCQPCRDIVDRGDLDDQPAISPTKKVKKGAKKRKIRKKVK